MAIDYTTLLFVDCMTTLTEKSGQSNTPPTEVIRLDVALVNTCKNEITEQEVIYVKPKKSKITTYCENLFKIKREKVEAEGIQFPELYRRLRIHYMSRDRLWSSWGIYEKFVLDTQCKSLSLEPLFVHSHHNIQHMFQVMTGTASDGNNPLMLSDGLKYCEIVSDNNQAVNIANLYIRMAKGLRAAPAVKTRIVIPGHQYKQQLTN